MADNFVRGYAFDTTPATTGEQTAAHLEDLVTLATLTSGSGILDNATLETYSDGGTYRARAAGITQAGAYAFRAFRSSDVAVSNKTATVIVFNADSGTIGFDYGSAFATGTGLFTAGVSGVHFFHAQARVEFVVGDIVAGNYCYLMFYKNAAWVQNGPPVCLDNYILSTTYNVSCSISGQFNLTAGDTMGVWIYTFNGGTAASTSRNISGASSQTFFCGHMVGRA